MSEVEKFSKTSREQRAFLAGRVLYRRLLNHWGSNFGSTPHSVSTGKWKFLGIPYWNIICEDPGGEWHPLVGDYGKQNIARRCRDSQLADSRLMKKTYGRGGPERKCFKDGTDGTMLNISVSDFLWWFCFHFCLMFRFPSWNTFAFFRFAFSNRGIHTIFPKLLWPFQWWSLDNCFLPVVFFPNVPGVSGWTVWRVPDLNSLSVEVNLNAAFHFFRRFPKVPWRKSDGLIDKFLNSTGWV